VGVVWCGGGAGVAVVWWHGAVAWCGGGAVVLIIILPRVVLSCPRLWQLKTSIILLFWQCSLQMKLAISTCCM
jgi:hypothetical protein